MSHFTVLVIGSHPEAQLAPFQENNMGDCPREYLEFHDVEEECRKDYEEDTVTRVKLGNGQLVSPYDDQFKKPNTMGFGTNTHTVPEPLEKIEVPVKEVYPDFEKYITEYHGYKIDSETGKYGYWDNPNKKWDWYLLGGRWTGFFKLKANVAGFTGIPGLMTEAAPHGFADQCLKSSIDFEQMRNDASAKAAEVYDFFVSHVDITLPFESWKSVNNRISNRDAARRFYQSQPRVGSLRRAEENKTFREKIGLMADLEEYNMARDEFIEAARNRTGVTFAVVKDGKWYEKGSMGWWGLVSDKKEQEVWNKEYQTLIDDLPDDTMLSVFDCHI